MKTQAVHINKRNSNKSSLSSLILIILLMPLLFSSALFAENEPNNSCSNANMLLDTNSETDSGWINGKVVDSSDSDWYKIVLTQQAELRFNREKRNNKKTKVKLFKSDCSSSAGWYKNNYTSHKTITLTSGTYYLKVWRSNTNNAKYKVKAYLTKLTDFSITKTVDNPNPHPGDIVTYTITASNNGPSNSEAHFSDTLPSGLTFVSENSGSCSQDGNGIDCKKWLYAYDTSTVTLKATVANNASGIITNSVSIEKDNTNSNAKKTFETNLNNNSASADINVSAFQGGVDSDLSITKEANRHVLQVGQVIRYTLVGTNNGPNPSQITITDNLPPELEYDSYYRNQLHFACTHVDNNVTCTGSHIFYSGDSVVVNIKAIVLSPTAVNIATISSASGNPDPDLSNNTSAATYSGNNERDFALQFVAYTNGNVKVIGNSAKLDDGGVCAPNGTNNNSLTTVYADKDSDSNTYNSTSADLKLPKNVKSSDILYATLYWQGRTAYGLGELGEGRGVKIKPYGQNNYINIETDTSKFNWYKGYSYQGVADVMGYVKASIDDTNQTVIENSGYDKPFWVADVFAPDNSNGFGAWSLVVAYKDNNAKLKNITVYDGFKRIYRNGNGTDVTEADVPLSGFITPTSGAVNAKFLIFGGEGDISLHDNISLTDKNGNDVSLGENIFKSSEDEDGINITNRNPSCQNTIGVDIRTFSIGTTGQTAQIIGNEQTSTTVKLRSGNDEYFPGVFAFSTDLYEPRVCYKQEFADVNGDPLGSISVGDTITVKTWISNMKKDAADGNLEPASQVEVELEFDSDNLEYISNSTIMKNIGEGTYSPYSDTNRTGLADHFTDNNSSVWRVGVGANSANGGLINPNASGDDSLKAFVELKTKLLQDGNITVQNIYKVSYLNTQLNLYFGHIPMAECADINSSLGIVALAGAFNVVSTSFSGATDPIDGTVSLNALYTQVSSESFTVRVLSLDSDNITLKSYTGDVNVSIINTPAFISGDDAGNQILCDNATSINSPQVLSFSGTNYKDMNIINTATATKSASFKIGYFAGSTQKYACSRDVFAIRPYSFRTFGKNQYKRAGEDFNITIMAVDDGNNNINSGKINDPSFANAVNGVNGYNASLGNLNITSNFYQPTPAQILQMQNDTGKTDVTTCPNSGTFTLNNPSTSFTNGEVNASLKFSETGILDLNISEKPGSEWAIVDASDTNDALRYIKPATQSFDETDISKNTILAFIPYKFDTTATYETTNSQNWLYIHDINKSNSTFTTPQMAAFIKYTITAMNKDGNTLQNYTKTCFPDVAEHTPYNPATDCPQVNTLKLNTTFDLFLNSNISITKDVNISLYTEDMNDSSAIFTSHKNMQLLEGNNSIREWISPLNFRAGVGKAKVYFNIDRNVSNAINPVKITLIDANTSTSWMANAGATNIFNGVTPNNSNATFLYARTHAPRSRFKDDNGTAFIYYEVFCDGAGCDKTLLPNGSGSNYTDDPRWFRNTLHTSVSGNVGIVTQKGGAGVVTAGALINTAGTTEVPLTYDRTKGFPYKTTMENNASSWLIYNKYDSNAKANEFEVEFQGGSTGWAGEHETNTTTKRGGTDRTNRRSMW